MSLIHHSVPSAGKSAPSRPDIVERALDAVLLDVIAPSAGVRCGAHQRKELECVCRYITRPAIANERLKRNDAGDVVLQLKSAWRDGVIE